MAPWDTAGDLQKGSSTSGTRFTPRGSRRGRWLQLPVGLPGLQVVREGGHELVTLGERGAGLLRGLSNEDLHARKGSSSHGTGRTIQAIHRVAGYLDDGLHAQDRSVEALHRIGRAEVVKLGVVRYRVLGVAMVIHRCS